MSLRAEIRALKRRLPAPSRVTDPVLAADPVELARRAGVDADPWQADVLRSRDPQIIMLASRQSGKSTVTSMVALHEAQYRPPALVLILSPSLRQSGELFAKIKAAHTALGADAVPLARETADTLQLVNGSRIVCLPSTEATVRGYSGVTLLIIDEASRVPDALYQATRPMLAVSGGRLMLLSTPWGKRGFFYEGWTAGEGWHRVRVTAEQCPRIPAEWLERERRSLPRHVFASEYQCEFGETLDHVFSHDDVEAAFDPALRPLFGAPLFERTG